MQIDDILTEKIQDIAERHGLKTTVTRMNDTGIDFIIQCKQISILNPKSGKKESTTPLIHGFGNYSPASLCIDVYGVYKLDGELIYASSETKPDGAMGSVLQKNRYASDGSSEGLNESIECVLRDVEKRLSLLEQMN